MNIKINILAASHLFHGIKIKDIEAGLFYLNPLNRKYKKGDIILLAGSKVTDVGIMLSGTAEVIKEDVRGNRSIITALSKSDMFAEALAGANVQRSPVSVIATSPCEVMFINFDRVINAKGALSSSGTVLIKNMLSLIAKRNVFLNNKLEHVSKRTLREKLLSYFNELSLAAGGKAFALPFSKTALADYLFVDRSAMGRELAAMRREGLIAFEGRNIKLK